MKLRRKRKVKIKVISIIGVISLVLLMSAGYAAFNTNISIGAKGNIVELTAAEQLRNECNTNEESGLYKDIYEENRCVYRGSNPNNYIEFNDELWRIIAVEADNTLKIIRDESIGKMAFDEAKYRNVEMSNYCNLASTEGCNAWSSVDNIYSLGLNVTQNASVNDFLNENYYNLFDIKWKDLIIKHNFYVGNIYLEDETTSFPKNLQDAKAILWQGNIGLLNATDYVSASLNENCKNIFWGVDTANYCSDKNYLKTDYLWWTLNGTSANHRSWVWLIDDNGQILQYQQAAEANEIRPVVFLKTDIYLEGSGMENSPYKILTE